MDLRLVNIHLPPPHPPQTIITLLQTLSLPTPSTVSPLKVTASFHTIYLIHFPPSTPPIQNARPNPDGTTTLVLRVSGRHLPGIKTRNEVGVMTWVRQHTTIPVPAIIRYDDTEDNVLGYEFTLLEKAPGVSVDSIYASLPDTVKTNIVRQLAGYIIQLHAQPWTDGYVGGLTVSSSTGGVQHLARGPPIDENYWLFPDVEKYWSVSAGVVPQGHHPTLETLNPIASRGFPDYVSYSVACLERYIHAIEMHPSLEHHRDLIPRVQAFVTQLQRPEYQAELNSVPYILAHKDLHFANIMCDPDQSDCPITAVLDWEFSGVVPAPRWNPPRAFLWNMGWGAEDKEEQTRMEGVFERVVGEMGRGDVLEEMRGGSKRMEQMQTVVSYLRAVVEVCPRGEAADRVGSWRGVVEGSMDGFGG
ncbi:phosphotransferase family protein [Aspergillus candidus]|uniref:APH-domain-containing protein n=1 Tax=Aspergillus candidus TaxID=41067 RepID=A0A2I2F1M6_ASPCN|nr:APH-domain-containing protein [Aspergillus candidus]PLB34535.1 APH-domain-containing protein [Aspergillus candidus]